MPAGYKGSKESPNCEGGDGEEDVADTNPAPVQKKRGEKDDAGVDKPERVAKDSARSSHGREQNCAIQVRLAMGQVSGETSKTEGGGHHIHSSVHRTDDEDVIGAEQENCQGGRQLIVQ
ncbi:MAG: hypothetical protein JO182_31735 [Acidobacteriaceae bacterium]|nr:hypothetical protein [Acidobacteriaceae bacterium]